MDVARVQSSLLAAVFILGRPLACSLGLSKQLVKVRVVQVVPGRWLYLPVWGKKQHQPFMFDGSPGPHIQNQAFQI